MATILSDINMSCQSKYAHNSETLAHRSLQPKFSLQYNYENVPAYWLPTFKSCTATNKVPSSINDSSLSYTSKTTSSLTSRICPNGNRIQQEFYSNPSGTEPVLLDRSDVLSYCSTSNVDETSNLQEDLTQSASSTDDSVYHCQKFRMGSNSSAQRCSKKALFKRAKVRQSGADSCGDDGGFEMGPRKPLLGVKERLRSSLDKISLNVAFKWGSSDKIPGTSFFRSSKSKQRSKNNRRYSDTIASILAVKSYDETKQPSKKVNSVNIEAENSSLSSVIEELSDEKGTNITGRNANENSKGSASCIHDDMKLVNANNLRIQNKVRTISNANPSCDNINGRVDVCDDRLLNNYRSKRNEKKHSIPPTHCQQDLINKDTVCRAKGTWKMLKSAKKKQIPIKSGLHFQPTSLVNEKTEHFHSEDLKTEEEHYCMNQDSSTLPSTNEPPKLTPVSGKLFLNECSENNILRPTAFRLVALSPNQNSSLAYCTSQAVTWEPSKDHTSSLEESYFKVEESCSGVSNEFNNPDSGRHSVNSISTPVTESSNCSCSGSEGYKSSRTSWPMQRDAMQEQDSGVDITSYHLPKKLSEDVMISDLENRVKSRQDEVHLLRRSLENNEKALHDMVCNERSQIQKYDVMETKQKYTRRIKSQQAYKSTLQSQKNTKRQCQRMHGDKKQLHAAKEVGHCHESTTEAIDARSRHNDDIAELKARLEVSEIEMQQRHGEISLLKRQIKEKQTDLTRRANETVTLKSCNRELCNKLTQQDAHTAALHECLSEREQEISELERRLKAATTRSSSSSYSELNWSTGNNWSDKTHKLKENSSNCSNCSVYSDKVQVEGEDHKVPGSFSIFEREELIKRLHAAEHRCVIQEQKFKREKRQWAEEKTKVIKYQKQLQNNYVLMYKRSHALEREVKILSSRLQAVGINSTVASGINKKISEPHDLSYPMEI